MPFTREKGQNPLHQWDMGFTLTGLTNKSMVLSERMAGQNFSSLRVLGEEFSAALPEVQERMCAFGQIRCIHRFYGFS